MPLLTSHAKLGITSTGATVASFDPAAFRVVTLRATHNAKVLLYEDVTESLAETGNIACDMATSRAIQVNTDCISMGCRWNGCVVT